MPERRRVSAEGLVFWEWQGSMEVSSGGSGSGGQMLVIGPDS